MIRKLNFRSRTEEENGDSGAETAGSDCSKRSCRSIRLMANSPNDLLMVTVHLLANPGASLLLQHTLALLLECVRPGLRLFHVSERSRPIHTHSKAKPSPAEAHPSHAVTIFLHDSYGDERALRMIDFLQCPPWQYHHTESSDGKSQNSTLMRDFYQLGTGMPIFGVRTIHYGEEVVRVTLNSTFENFEDSVRLYETVLQRRAEEQKAGFCWFTLLADAGFSLQFAIKRLGPGVRVEQCHAAVLQFRVGEIGQLVPLMPNPCSPISTSRWHTEDLDGNKILFQTKPPSRSQTFHACAFPPSDRSRSPRLRTECGRESLCSEETGSSCYSSQRSSPAGQSINCSEPMGAVEMSLSRLVLEKDESETDVDTGCAVNAHNASFSAYSHCKPSLEDSPRTTVSTETPRTHPADEFFI